MKKYTAIYVQREPDRATLLLVVSNHDPLNEESNEDLASQLIRTLEQDHTLHTRDHDLFLEIRVVLDVPFESS